MLKPSTHTQLRHLENTMPPYLAVQPTRPDARPNPALEMLFQKAVQPAVAVPEKIHESFESYEVYNCTPPKTN